MWCGVGAPWSSHVPSAPKSGAGCTFRSIVFESSCAAVGWVSAGSARPSDSNRNREATNLLRDFPIGFLPSCFSNPVFSRTYFRKRLENYLSLKLAFASCGQSVKERTVGPSRRCGLSADISAAGLLRAGRNGQTARGPVLVRVLEIRVVEDVLDVRSYGDLHPFCGVEILSHSEVGVEESGSAQLIAHLGRE